MVYCEHNLDECNQEYVKVVQDVRAALRSAPPSAEMAPSSGPEMYEKMPEAFQAFLTKTNAGEERQDYVQGSDAERGEELGYANSRPAINFVASEQVPAAPDGFTGSREVREDARKSSTADKSVEYSGPQDSPSRSEPNFVECSYCGFDYDINSCMIGCPHNPRSRPAPPSPAPEKEK